MRSDRAIATVFATLLVAALTSCKGGRAEPEMIQVPGGDASRGAEVIGAFGCGACHTIPGVDGASGAVGPPLSFWSRRSYIAGKLPNTPDNLIRWVSDPHAIEPGTAMPDVGVSEQQARDVAAYLYTLK